MNKEELSPKKHINTFDLNRVEIEMRQQPTITKKLDYWLNIKTKHIDPLLKNVKSKQFTNNSALYNILPELFGDNNKLISPLEIPENIYNEHFTNGINNPEFTYWFLKYNAKKYFETVYDIKSLESKLRSPIAKQYITAELKKLTDFEDNANNLLLNNKVDIYSPHHNTKYTKEIELLRIKGDYYEKHVLPFVHSTNATTILYADHIYLKDCLTTSIQVANIGFNKAVISEYTSNKVYELNHIKIGTLGIVEGFFIYLSTIEKAEDFFINSNLNLDNNPFRNIFEEYFKKAFTDHLKKTKTLSRLNEIDFKEHLYSKEVDNLLIFKKYISYFISEKPIQFLLLKKNDEFLDWLKPQTQEVDSTIAPQAISFIKNNYESEILNWNKKNNNNLTKWLKSGQLVKIEEWHFINKERLIEQKQVLKDLYGLIDMILINNADMHDEIIHMCKNNALSIRNTIDEYFASAMDIAITLPFVSLCPKIIEQPQYLIEAHLKYDDNLSEYQKIYYRYDYLKNKIGFGKDKFLKYKKKLNSSIRLEVSNKNNDLINNMFLFIEQFIEDLNSMHRTQFNYIASPLFRLLFKEIIKFKDYYYVVFGRFSFTNILETEKLLNSLDEYAEPDLQLSQKNKLDTNDLLSTFNKIIKGSLRPHLIKNDNLSKINDLLKISFYYDDESKSLKTDDENWNLTAKNGQLLELSIDTDNPDNNTIKPSPDESLEELINIDMPPPPDEKSKAFLKLIERENLLIQAKASYFLKNSNSSENNKLFAFKNIQLLKELAESLHLYIKKLGGEHGNLYITDANHFITHVLQYNIIYAIQFLQKTFSPFINTEVESSTKLKLILFHESTPRIPEFLILPLLPKKKEFEIFKENLHFKLNSNRQYKPDPSIGEKLFNFYKSKNNDLSQRLQLLEYNQNLIFWNNLLITNKLKTIVNERYVNEPEIEKILIPLLNSEIEILENQIKFESTDSHSTVVENDLHKDKPNSINLSNIDNQLLSDSENSLFEKNLAIIENYATSVQNKFITDKDFILFTKTLAKFFSSIPYNKDISIKLQLRSKTAVARIFNPIHKKIGNIETLINNTEYFEIIRILEPFKDYDDNKIYRMLIK